MEEAIVLYPAPGVGHIISMVELGNLLCRHYHHRFSIIILLTTGFMDDPNIDAFISTTSQTNPSLSFLRFPQVLVDTTPTRSHAAVAFEFIRLNASHVLHSLNDVSGIHRIKAFIIDFFCTSALTAVSASAGLNKIPTYYFFTSGAAALAAYLYMPAIHEQVSSSFKDLKDTVLHFPGLPPIPATHMPEPLLDRADPAYDDMIYFSSHLPKSDGILVNTFDELEPVAMAAISGGSCVPDSPTPPVYNVGPLIAGTHGGEDGGNGRPRWLTWLDSQPAGSVAFLCFGSRGTFEGSQLKEMAEGLERSGHRFLWVLRTAKGVDRGGSIFPDGFGFEERTKGRGMVLVNEWVRQVEVLQHEAVGGFVTHCGWNSVLEAVVAGKPMVAWPLYAEQHVNRAALVEDMRMAIPVVGREGDGLVTGEEVARRIGELMESEKGRELKERSRAMREKALAASAGNGCSTENLARLVRSWLD